GERRHHAGHRGRVHGHRCDQGTRPTTGARGERSAQAARSESRKTPPPSRPDRSIEAAEVGFACSLPEGDGAERPSTEGSLSTRGRSPTPRRFQRGARTRVNVTPKTRTAPTPPTPSGTNVSVLGSAVASDGRVR